MRKLKVLPPNISNLIAAGEVVQRPSSVVKELLENSVDAGADNIKIIIEDAGRTSIQVIDNGSGMSSDDASLCFERHATSKISTAGDLESIMTYGFRGEALPSIAAVSEVTVRTRRKTDPVGVEVRFAASSFLSSEEVSCSEGTNITVRNIFYNVPARRKFLKSDAAEMRNIVAEFSHVALCRPDIAFRLVHNGRDVYNLRKANSLKQRILEIEGKGLVKELVDIGTDTGFVKIYGFIGHPEDARKSTGNQYFFVNGRYFRSPYFHKALMKGYEKLIPDDTVPSYFLFFETDASNVDVNIHPAKTEVKFENEAEIFEILTAAVRESLGKNSFIPVIDFDHDALPEVSYPLFNPQKSSGFRSSSMDSPMDYAPLVSQVIPSRIDAGSSERTYDAVTEQDSVDGYGQIFEDKGTTKDTVLSVGDRYIVTTLRSGLLVINVKRARERICYEKFLHKLDNSEPIMQQVLFPCNIELSQMDYSLLMENPGRLEMLGFDISSTGGTSISVNGLPDGFSTDPDSVRAAIDGLVVMFSDSPSDELLKAEGREKMASRLARCAVMGEHVRLNQAEARVLVDTLFGCSEPEYSPSGKKCMEIISEEELDKRL